MGARNKLLEVVDGVAVVRRVVDAAVGAGASPVVVVTGHQASEVEAAVRGAAAVGEERIAGSNVAAVQAAVEVLHNARWSGGMSTSIAAGIEALGARVDAALVCLGDMPRLTAEDVATVMRAFDARSPLGALASGTLSGGGASPSGPQSAVAAEPVHALAVFVPTFGGRRGNPVLWTADWFDQLKDLSGDKGAKGLLESLGDLVIEVAAPDDGVLRDVDTPEALEELRGSS
jgi:molybdenum cofactor cytidylyltransferase